MMGSYINICKESPMSFLVPLLSFHPLPWITRQYTSSPLPVVRYAQPSPSWDSLKGAAPRHHLNLRTQFSMSTARLKRTPDLLQEPMKETGKRYPRTDLLGSILVPSFDLPLQIHLKNIQQPNVNLHKGRTCHLILYNNHYLYNIAGLIRGNPLPSAIPVLTPASDANRNGKQDLFAPFTICPSPWLHR